MDAHAQSEQLRAEARPAATGGKRWGVAGMLFAVTVINYVDRQTLSALSPILKDHFAWSSNEYAFILNAFRVSYTVMQAVFGRVLDRFGTRRGIAWSVSFYSVVGAMTALSQGFYSFVTFRFLLGAGEAANNPGGAKAVSEWFPARERAIAIAIFNSGCAVGAMIAPWIALGIYHVTHRWQPAFLVAGIAGLLWLIVWYKNYRTPEEHPTIGKGELEYIRSGRSSAPASAAGEMKFRWWQMLRYRQAWGLILGGFCLTRSGFSWPNGIRCI